jgi:ABC-type branched-subunit amino acid transport system permease subunit
MAIACAVAAVAGALYCTYVGFIDPTSFTLMNRSSCSAWC